METVLENSIPGLSDSIAKVVYVVWLLGFWYIFVLIWVVKWYFPVIWKINFVLCWIISQIREDVKSGVENLTEECVSTMAAVTRLLMKVFIFLVLICAPKCTPIHGSTEVSFPFGIQVLYFSLEFKRHFCCCSSSCITVVVEFGF